jgi:hypothetical protein
VLPIRSPSCKMAKAKPPSSLGRLPPHDLPLPPLPYGLLRPPLDLYPIRRTRSSPLPTRSPIEIYEQRFLSPRSSLNLAIFPFSPLAYNLSSPYDGHHVSRHPRRRLSHLPQRIRQDGAMGDLSRPFRSNTLLALFPFGFADSPVRPPPLSSSER